MCFVETKRTSAEKTCSDCVVIFVFGFHSQAITQLVNIPSKEKPVYLETAILHESGDGFGRNINSCRTFSMHFLVWPRPNIQVRRGFACVLACQRSSQLHKAGAVVFDIGESHFVHAHGWNAEHQDSDHLFFGHVISLRHLCCSQERQIVKNNCILHMHFWKSSRIMASCRVHEPWRGVEYWLHPNLSCFFVFLH